MLAVTLIIQKLVPWDQLVLTPHSTDEETEAQNLEDIGFKGKGISHLSWWTACFLAGLEVGFAKLFRKQKLHGHTWVLQSPPDCKTRALFEVGTEVMGAGPPSCYHQLGPSPRLADPRSESSAYSAIIGLASIVTAFNHSPYLLIHVLSCLKTQSISTF